MSVVNRMLLDIDRRNGAADIRTQGPYPDIRSVPLRAAIPGRRNVVVALVVAAVIAFTAAVVNRAGWLDRTALPVVKPLAIPNVVAPSATPAVAPPVAAVPVASIPAAATPVEQPAVTAAVTEPEAPLPKPAARARTASSGIESFKLSRQLSNVDERLAASPAPAAVALPRVAAAATIAPPKASAPVRQVAGDETIAVARALWNGGARADALATLREALSAAEGARNPAAVAPIARELARLEVADNRPQAALDLLRRLEGMLAEDADAWALRGNAEQRLAQHGDSARSYLAALRMRPAEGRWMLGAAISLAADGKPDEGQAWAERARERGVVTPAIEAYLQQLGIAARR